MNSIALTILFIIITARLILAEQCVTPNNETAECVSLYSCPVILKELGTSQNETFEFVRQSNCGGTPTNPMVCCGSSASFIKKNNQESSVVVGNLLPSNKVCGLQHSDDYFHTEKGTIITEFPWLAHIEHKRKNGSTYFACSGSLISSRYVLTAAHCLKNIEGQITAISIRLGEYNVKTETDCTEDSQLVECSDPVRDYKIGNIIFHPDYRKYSKNDDIALIRLNESVQYSDYIRPICLPFPERKLSKVGDNLTASGWGRIGFGSVETAEIKKKVLSTVISNEECSQVLNKYGNINLSDNQFCVKMFENSSEVNCQGDSGVPVLFSHRAQWHQEGIVSFSVKCSHENPIVLVKVRNYLDWIQDNIKP